MNAIFLGIMGEYIGRIYDQIRMRPTVVIEQLVNMAEERERTADFKYPGLELEKSERRTPDGSSERI